MLSQQCIYPISVTNLVRTIAKHRLRIGVALAMKAYRVARLKRTGMRVHF
jgi:hypothetical protein